MEYKEQLETAEKCTLAAININSAIENLITPKDEKEADPKTLDCLHLLNLLNGTLLDIAGCIGDIEGTNQEDETLTAFQQDLAETENSFREIWEKYKEGNNVN